MSPIRPVSDAFLRAVRGSHRMVAEARVVEPGQTGVAPAGTVIPILDGDVQLDGTAPVRSTLDLATEGRGMWPTDAAGLLAPYGNEIHVRRGIQFGNGTTEWVSLGYFRIQRPEQADVPRGPIRIAAQDRMAGIVEARMIEPRAYPSSATCGSVMADLVGEVYPWAVIEWDDDTDTDALNRDLVAEEDRHKFLAELVAAKGKIWHWDHRGILVIRTAPSPAEPVVDVNHGEGGVLVTLSRQLSREGIYNGVVVVGESTDGSPPVRSVAVDINPDSPTYWHGKFGKVPRFFNSSFITTEAQATNAGTAMLTRQLGLPYSANFAAVPNPALEPWDPIRVSYPGGSELHVIDQLTVPLTAQAPLTGSTREKTDVIVGSP